jgi:hypothetical protein
MHRARAAQSHPAPKLGAGHSQGVAQDPQQGSGGIYIHLYRFSIHMKTCHPWSPSGLDRKWAARLDGIISPKVTGGFAKITWFKLQIRAGAKIRAFSHSERRITNRNNPQLPFSEWH